ncbi:TetR/AcrR family transcriptional regulator [Paenibacillaceae bacterium WGS1546]|uniref:TetR/AcrR family transcriptional regulator n=1 Tax=Cohnella sp. WGS1546 TaxID=3366810 RepID=UPI00372D3622
MAMQDKKKQILDAAIHCFARKGFNATSIQEIADEIGMAKGSLYFYFKSKDDLLVSIIDYYSEMMFEQMETMTGETGFPPREKLALQFERQFRFVRENLDFMRMLMKEPLTGLHPHIREMLIRLRARSRLWYMSHILAIYGDEAKKYSGDATAMIAGIGSQYFEALLFEDQAFDERRLSRFLTQRLDEIMFGMIRGGEEPVLPPHDIAKLRSQAGIAADDSHDLGLLQEALDLVAASAPERDEDVQRDLVAALTVIRDEIVKSGPTNRLLLRAMLALLKEYGTEEIRATMTKLEARLAT